jgi:hypothetical protein
MAVRRLVGSAPREAPPLGGTLPPHAYLLLSTQPEKAQLWNSHTQAFVPVVSMPFDVDELLA